MTVRNQSEEGLLAVHLAVQRSRALVFVAMYSVAMVGWSAGILDFELRWGHALAVAALASAAVFYELYRRRLDRRWGVDLSAAWMACDVLLITWVVFLTRGSSSIWLVWYLTNSAAAAFVAGRRAALWVTVANSGAYLTLLVLLGEIRGFDRGLINAVVHLGVLYSASFYFLRGIADLRDKRLEIRRLARERAEQLEELKRLTAALDRQARELAEAHRTSQEASRAKSQFLANMSHELRTPLNSIIGFSEILRTKTADRLEPRHADFLRIILESGRHLLALINDVLDLSKIEAGKMELALEEVVLGDLIHGVRAVMRGVAAGRGIELAVELADDLPPIVADGPRVKQILYNLASNAVKFSPDGARVVIGARALPADESPLGAEAVEVRVVDQGIGIAPEEHDAIFEEFSQVDTSNRVHRGTGLGLALVKRFAEMHGGTVAVDSAPGRGSTFRVILPVDASRVVLTPEAPAPVRKVPQPPGDGGPVVMVVEDEEPFYRALAADLEDAGYQPRWAHHGEDALRLAREIEPAAITLDLALPGMDGWEVLKALKDDETTRDIPVIIVSLLENHELGLALEAEDYFLKPLDRRGFLDRLRQLQKDAPNAKPRE